jgi:hypothetical protein
MTSVTNKTAAMLRAALKGGVTPPDPNVKTWEYVPPDPPMHAEEVADLVNAALPPDWVGGRYTTHIHSGNQASYLAEFVWSRELDPGYRGMMGLREVRVSAECATVDQMIELAKLLPDLERLGALSWPVQFSVDTVI